MAGRATFLGRPARISVGLTVAIVALSLTQAQAQVIEVLPDGATLT